ncbi:hypothetical protein LCGC14_1411710 [marine sediment metagenome]|uniref:Uncharacterized protein n=1 Tax=marine sediment metagenome TaxID=412755 RepID=A0A0F9KF61_9ZZZZ
MAGDGLAVERRLDERRGDWIGNACDVPCKPVDDKLISVWKEIKVMAKEKVSWKVFAMVVSGIGSIGLIALVIMMAMVNHNQEAIDVGLKSISSSFSELNADVRVQNAQLSEVQGDVKEIRREVRRMNGGRKRWENTNP